mgnify:FL=1
MVFFLSELFSSSNFVLSLSLSISPLSYRVHVRHDGLDHGPLVRRAVEQVQGRVEHPRGPAVGRGERRRREQVGGKQQRVGPAGLRECRGRRGRGGLLPLQLELASSSRGRGRRVPSRRRRGPNVRHSGKDPQRGREQPVRVAVRLRAVELDAGVPREDERRAGEGEGRGRGRRRRRGDGGRGGGGGNVCSCCYCCCCRCCSRCCRRRRSGDCRCSAARGKSRCRCGKVAVVVARRRRRTTSTSTISVPIPAARHHHRGSQRRRPVSGGGHGPRGADRRQENRQVPLADAEQVGVVALRDGDRSRGDVVEARGEGEEGEEGDL